MLKAMVSLGISILASASAASEGDLLLDVGLAPVTRTLQDYARPSLGAQVSLLSGFTERVDLGVTATWDHMKGKGGTGDLDISSLSIQGWLGFLDGDFRPQLGIATGVAMDAEADAFLHLSARARAVLQLSTKVRLYAGAAIGGDFGDKGSQFARGEFGSQLLLW